MINHFSNSPQCIYMPKMYLQSKYNNNNNNNNTKTTTTPLLRNSLLWRPF